MSAIAIRAENLSKRYKITTTRYRHDMLRDKLVESLRSAFRRNGAPHRTASSFWALRDVSFEVKQGEMLGIVGRNGAGKSTLLKLLSRITEPTSGRAEISGRIGSLLEVGTGFDVELTGRENIYLNGAILGMRKAEIDRKFDDIVAFAEVDKFIDTPVKHYSSGMYVRLAFAVAAHLEPEILLLDEVLSVGDLPFQRKCMEHAKRLQSGNATVLFVSHNMFAVKAMCNRVIYLSSGRVRLDGSPEEAIQLYERDSRLAPAQWAQHLLGDDPPQRPIHVTDMEVLDEQGQPRTIFNYGDRLRVRMHFESPGRIENPNFCIGLIRSDNVPCCCFSTGLDGFTTPSSPGQNVIELLTPPLKLISDLYTIHVNIWNRTFQKHYGAQICATFHVRDSVLSTHFGVFHEPGEWSLQPRQAGVPGEAPSAKVNHP
jgi:lipopolysaccharide transport system ATP-binding protein